MQPWLRWTLAIGILVLLLVIFVVTFILYRRTPAPKGCEDLEPNEGKCSGCQETGCHFSFYYKSKDHKPAEENKKEEKESK